MEKRVIRNNFMSNLFKSKILLGVMIVAVLFVGVFALTMNTAKAECTLQDTLKVGSSLTTQVMCLQSKLGMTLQDGKFGPNTLSMVKNFQTANGLKADGIVGFNTRTALNGTVVENPAPTPTPSQGNCPTGYVAVTPVAPTFAACVVSGGSSATGTTDGSITATTSSYVTSGITVKKGETKNVVATKLQAIVGPVKVTRVDVEFNVRPWLFFGTVALKDSNGTVLATKTMSSILDTTELTVGSLYLVRFDGLNYTVTPGTNPDLAVSVSVLPATDKIPTLGQSVTTTISDIRTLSEVGYSDSATGTGQNNNNTVTLTSTGSVADVYSRVSPNSPLAGQQVVNATSGQTTENVVLGAFSLKSASNASTLNTLSVGILGSANIATTFSNYRLYVGGVSVGGATLASPTITFSNLTVPLALDTWTDFVVKADVAGASSGTVQLTLIPTTTSVVVTDSNYSTATIEAGTRTTNLLTLTSNSVTISGTTAVIGTAIVQGNVTTGYNATYAFTLTNNSNSDLYVSATPTTFVTCATTGSTGTTTGTGLTSITPNPSQVSGDDSGATYYAIPAGSVRSFSFAAVLRGPAGATTIYKATSINYGTATTALTGYNIATGLSSLSLTSSF